MRYLPILPSPTGLLLSYMIKVLVHLTTVRIINDVPCFPSVLDHITTDLSKFGFTKTVDTFSNSIEPMTTNKQNQHQNSQFSQIPARQILITF